MRHLERLPLGTCYPEVVGGLQSDTIRPTESYSRENGGKNKVRKAEDFSSSFDVRPESLETLAAKQGVKAATNFDELLGDFWPEDEGAEEFITALKEWRRDGDA